MMGSADSSKTYQRTRLHIPEDHYFTTNRRDKIELQKYNMAAEQPTFINLLLFL
jgi:hypothetical protein